MLNDDGSKKIKSVMKIQPMIKQTAYQLLFWHVVFLVSNSKNKMVVIDKVETETCLQ